MKNNLNSDAKNGSRQKQLLRGFAIKASTKIVKFMALVQGFDQDLGLKYLEGRPGSFSFVRVKMLKKLQLTAHKNVR